MGVDAERDPRLLIYLGTQRLAPEVGDISKICGEKTKQSHRFSEGADKKP
jgi:hypothetical protein